MSCYWVIDSGPRWFSERPASLRHSLLASTVMQSEHERESMWNFCQVYWKNKKSVVCRPAVLKTEAKCLIFKVYLVIIMQRCIQKKMLNLQTQKCLFFSPSLFIPRVSWEHVLQFRRSPRICKYTFVVNPTDADIMISKAVFFALSLGS